MKKYALLAVVLIVGTALAQTAQPPQEEKKAPAPGTLKVKLNYSGAGVVDEKHQIRLFLFDSPDFVQGGVMPFASGSAASKDGIVTFPDLDKSPVYVAAIYDPSGDYDGASGPPPSGASMVYTARPQGSPSR